MNSTGVLLEARSIGRFARESQNWLLREVSLAVCGGDRLAIFGPTGSGKTLLLRSLSLLDSTDEGQLLWLNGPVVPGSVPDFRRHVIYLHQRPALIEGTVEENLRLPFSFAIHAHEEFDRNWVLATLGKVERGADFLVRSWRDLSGGEAQIVALVRALQLHPTVLLLDEPTASLDATAAQAIEQLVSQWHQQSNGGRAVVWVTHDREQSSRVANRFVWMDSGRLVHGE
jgi:putative ABC transport system ATP-binding protein